MEQEDVREVFWQNISALMEKHYDGEALGRFAVDCGFGPPSMTRYKQRAAYPGADILEKIAKRFQLQPWQLLAPQLGEGLYALEGNRLISVLDFPQHAPARAAETVAPHQPQESQWKRRKSGREREAKQKKPPSNRRRGSAP